MRHVQELADPRRRYRRAEQIALHFADRAIGADQFELLVGLDAFDHDRHAEVGRQPRHAAQQRQRPVAVDSLQEGAVDLHLLQREVMQVAQARIAGAEIVERNPHAERMQLRQHVVRQLRVPQQRRLRDLDFEPVCRQPLGSRVLIEGGKNAG